ncbi:hypothetical protein P9139_09705 [Curtobacterium flaccumfaciens]|nr:hypothetical protein P9139_09705 [Curtobacterium flaccumfaciens]
MTAVSQSRSPGLPAARHPAPRAVRAAACSSGSPSTPRSWRSVS